MIAGQLQVFVESGGRSATDPPESPRLAYLVAVEIGDRLLELGHRSPRHKRADVIDEALQLMLGTIGRDLASPGRHA